MLIFAAVMILGVLVISFGVDYFPTDGEKLMVTTLGFLMLVAPILLVLWRMIPRGESVGYVY
jgi:hypothetical protein